MLPDPVTGFAVTDCMLQEHYLQGVLGICVSEFPTVDKGCDSCAKVVYTLFRELPDI